MAYLFFLKNKVPTGASWGEGGMFALGNELKNLFDQVCLLSTCSFSDSDFRWDPASVPDTSLLVYVLPDQGSSLIRRVKPRAPLGSGGTTHVSTAGNLSEAYFNPTLPDANPLRLLANLIFHEAMHNLLNQGQSLHGSGGQGLATGGKIYSTTTMTQPNKDLMAPALGKKVLQNTSFL